MTPSSSVEVSDSLDEARSRLLRSARVLTRTWVALLCLGLGLVTVTAGALVVASMMSATYVVIWSVLLAATSFNVTRYWPRRRELPGVVVREVEHDELRRALDPRGVVEWPARTRLTVRPELEVTGDELVLGMPLLASLDAGQLGELVAMAARAADVEDERSLRWALRVAHGEVGRSLVGARGRQTWPTYRLTSTLRSQAAVLVADLDNHAATHQRAWLVGPRVPAARVRARAVADQVIEAWQFVDDEWLAPAYERGRRPVAPFSGLRLFLEGADVHGWLTQPGPTWASGPVARLVAAYEDRLAQQLAAERTGTRADRLRPLEWSEHASEVSVPHWRALVAETLDVARRSTRDHDAVRLETLLAVLEAGEGASLARATAEDRELHDSDADQWSERFVSRVLTAGIGIAALDGRDFHPTWSWPRGTTLADARGRELPVEAMVEQALDLVRDGGSLEAAYGELRVALDELGIAVDEPLWLDAATGRPEEPIGSFVARQGLSSRLVVVTDRALHVFRHPRGRQLLKLLRRPDPRDDSFDSLRKRMVLVWQGDSTDELATAAREDVARARFGPAVGGYWWRLRLSTGLTLRGHGDGYAAQEVVEQWLGDRLTTTWLDAPPAVRRRRDRVGRVATALGAAALLAALVVAVAGWLQVGAALIAVAAVGLLAARVPDVVAELTRLVRQRAALRPPKMRVAAPTGGQSPPTRPSADAATQPR